MRTWVLVPVRSEKVLTLGGTQKEYYVDLWSGNHPFFQGQTSSVVVDEGAVVGPCSAKL